MTTKLVAQEPPAAGARRRAIADLNQSILDLARSTPMRPVEVAAALELPTHQVATRMKMLTERGLMKRHRNVGQNNGPGASTYQTVGKKRVAAA